MNLNCVSFLVSSILVVPLIVQLLIISQSCYLIDCLSLTELHSTLPSNNNNNNNHNRFRSRLSQEKSIRDAIRNLNHLHHQRLTNSNRNSVIDSSNYHPRQSTNNNYELIVDDLDAGNDPNRQYLPDLPIVVDDDGNDLQANLPNYLIVKSPTINGINKRQDEVVMDIPLEYTSDIPYEFYPELWPSYQQKSLSFQGKVDDDDDDDNDLSSSDILSQVLAAKIANLLETESSRHPQRKRVLVKRNHRSGLSGISNGGNHNRGRSNKVAPNLPSKSNLRMTSSKKSIFGDSKQHSSELERAKETKVSKVTSRKLGDTKKVKLNRVPLKATLAGHQPVKGDFAKLVNGKAVHMSPMRMHSKAINSTKSYKELEKSKKQPLISKNFRKIEATHRIPPINLNRKEKPVTTAITNPSAHQSSMKEFFNEIDLPKGSNNKVKRSISSRSAPDLAEPGLRREDDTLDVDDDTDDGDDAVDGNNNGRRGEDDIGSEVSENEYISAIGQLASSQPMVLQSNPWLVDEATRTLMRSLTVKRRKRGNSNNEDDQLTLIGLDDRDLTTTSTTTTTSTSTGDNNDDDDGKRDDTNSKINNNINDDQVRISEIDEATSSIDKPIITDIIDFDDADEIPARIVKKDGVTLSESHPGTDEDDNINLQMNKKQKKLDKELITNGSQLKSTGAITSLLDGVDQDGDNETFFEEEFSEGLISIGDLDDLDKINKSIVVNSLINEENDDEVKNKQKRVNRLKEFTFSSSSTLPPSLLTNGDQGRIEGSFDPDEQLLVDTINKGFLVNNKRKRSVTPTPYFGKVGEASSSSALIVQETNKFNDVDDRLERIEETLILEALDLVKGNLNGETDKLVSEDKAVKHRIESRLNAAYDLEDMRLALTDLHKIIQQMSTEDEDGRGKGVGEDQDVDRNNDHDNEISDVPGDRDIYLDSTGKVSLSGKLDDDDDDEQDVKGDIGNRNKETNNNYYYRDPIMTRSHHLNHLFTNECPAIRVLTTDCSAVKDVVPYGPLQKIFGQACNWHEVCYSCGELFGLLSSDCDMGFLEQSRLACNDSASCETASRLILMPLKSRRIFYKQKVPPMCYQEPCVETFLLKSRRER